MRLKLILTTAIVGTALALPGIASAAPPAPTFQDSVSLPEAPATYFVPQAGFLQEVQITELTATSGPNGENPTGSVFLFFSVNVFGSKLTDSGPVTCLAVSGNRTTLNFQSAFLSGTTTPIVTMQVVDDDPDTVSLLTLGRAATDCSPPPPLNINPLTSGDIAVVDAPAPTTREQCMNGGWAQFGFANQGLCLAFVNRS